MNSETDKTSAREWRGIKHPDPSGSVDYRPVYDEEAMRRFVEEGTKAFGTAEPSPSLSQRERGWRERGSQVS